MKGEKIMGYAEEYFDLIRKALKEMVVTDRRGNEMGADEAFQMWSEKAYWIREEAKGLLFFCGNGASETMAEHMSHDWFQNALVNTTTVSETAHITAISNDYGYDEVYRYRVRRILSERDMFIGISSSGNSPNIVKALAAAAENRAYTISVTGMKPDNKLRTMGDMNFYVPLNTYGEVESAHAVLLHAALDCFLDRYMEGRH